KLPCPLSVAPGSIVRVWPPGTIQVLVKTCGLLAAANVPLHVPEWSVAAAIDAAVRTMRAAATVGPRRVCSSGILILLPPKSRLTVSNWKRREHYLDTTRANRLLTPSHRYRVGVRRREFLVGHESTSASTDRGVGSPV